MMAVYTSTGTVAQTTSGSATTLVRYSRSPSETTSQRYIARRVPEYPMAVGNELTSAAESPWTSGTLATSTEWIEHEPCTDEAAVERYYRRAGALTGIAYLLEFTDCQFENLLVAGEHPVLVDAETVMHPFVDRERRPARTGLATLMDDSVLLTSLLPFGIRGTYDDDRSDLTRAVAGFSRSAEQFELDAFTVPRITAVNTDVMTVEETSPSVDRDENVPHVDGTERPPGEYLDDVVDGFETTYETVLELRDDGRLRESVGIPDAFESTVNRVVYRPTMQYARVIESLCSRACLHDGARSGVEMEELAVPFFDGQVGDPKPWPFYEAERRAIKRLDPPRFTSRTHGTEIERAGDPIGVSADESGFERSLARIESASPADMREQVELLRGAFGARPRPASTVDTSPDIGDGTDERLRPSATCSATSRSFPTASARPSSSPVT